MRPDAIGIGWRPELAADLIRAPKTVDFVEVVAETCFARPEARREVRALSELWPVVPHGVKLSLGAADGIDLQHARELGDLAREVSAPVLSEHVALTRSGGLEIGHLTSLPYTREAVRVVARNVAAARRVLPEVPFLLENVARTFDWPEDAMGEGDFYGEIVRATGCSLLLDVANLYANALNSGISPLALLRAYPLQAVGMVHIAGGVSEDGFYLDTHAHAVPRPVFDLLHALFRSTGPVPALIERDAGFPPFAELEAELGHLRTIARQTLPARPWPIASAAVLPLEGEKDSLSFRQTVVARMLTQRDPPDPRDARPFGTEAIFRTREILDRKRVDDAIPLLPRVGQRGEELRKIALAVVKKTPRATRGAGIADAVTIARAACAHDSLAPLAHMDLLELRSRFSREQRPRAGPFLGREALPGGGTVWAFKGPGRHAAIRLWHARR